MKEEITVRKKDRRERAVGGMVGLEEEPSLRSHVTRPSQEQKQAYESGKGAL